MKKNLSKLITCLAILSASCSKSDKEITVNAYAIGNSNELISFNISKPSETKTTTITGLQTGETIHAIDIRPANNQLYTLGSTSRIYQLNTSTGAATAIGTVPFTPANKNFNISLNL